MRDPKTFVIRHGNDSDLNVLDSQWANGVLVALCQRLWSGGTRF